MTDEDVPGVDPAEVAALERGADRIAVPPLPASVQRAVMDAERDLEPGRDTSSVMRGSVPPGAHTTSEPKGALETLVEQAVAARFDDLRDDLADLKRWGRHTMHLAMVLAHVLRVAPEEVDEAKRKVDAADLAIRKES